jgi:hypothetical protein
MPHCRLTSQGERVMHSASLSHSNGHLVEGSKGTVVLGIGRKELADEHRHTVHRVFRQL